MHGRTLASWAALAAAALAPLMLTASGEWPPLNGDEPHYVALADSLLRDGDLELSGDYAADRIGWLELGPVTPHVKPGAAPGSGYSFHGAGLAFLLAPFLALDPVPPLGLRVLGALCSLVVGLGLLYATRMIDPSLPALAIALLGQLTAPVLFNVPHLFPDLPAAALSISIWVLAERQRGSLAAAIAAGSLLIGLPWLHFKFLTLWVVLAALVAIRWRRPAPGAAAGALAIAAIGPLSLCAWNYSAFGSASPTAAASYPAEIATQASPILAYLGDPGGALRTAIGLWVDQKDGLLAWAPWLLLAAAGAGWCWRRHRARLIGLLVLFAAVWAPTALSQNTGLWGPPGRWLLSVSWVPVLLAGIGLATPTTDLPLRRWRGALLGLTVTLTTAYVLHPSLLYVDRGDTRSPLLQFVGGPGVPLWELFPVWTRYGVPAWAATLTWTAAAIVAAVWLWRRGADCAEADRDARGAVASPVSTRAGALGLLLAVVALTVPRLIVPIGGPEVVRTVEYGGVEFHLPTRPAARAWPHPTTVWFGGDDQVAVRISTDSPVRSIEFELLAPIDQTVTVSLGNDAVTVEIASGQNRRVRLVPGRARRWRGRAYLPLVVRTGTGIIGSDFSGVATDRRWLGVNLSVTDLVLEAPSD